MQPSSTGHIQRIPCRSQYHPKRSTRSTTRIAAQAETRLLRLCGSTNDARSVPHSGHLSGVALISYPQFRHNRISALQPGQRVADRLRMLRPHSAHRLRVRGLRRKRPAIPLTTSVNSHNTSPGEHMSQTTTPRSTAIPIMSIDSVALCLSARSGHSTTAIRSTALKRVEPRGHVYNHMH